VASLVCPAVQVVVGLELGPFVVVIAGVAGVRARNRPIAGRRG
jgi:hypothetical protein